MVVNVDEADPEPASPHSLHGGPSVELSLRCGRLAYSAAMVKQLRLRHRGQGSSDVEAARPGVDVIEGWLGARRPYRSRQWIR